MKNTATFHFDAPLHFFLKEEMKRDNYSYSFDGTPTVKDTIEAQGVPHVEVEWIQVNGEFVDFSYRLKDGDEIHVFSLEADILQPCILREKIDNYRFMIDFNVRKMAKYLRMYGFDVITDEGVPDKEIAEIAAAENRIVISRDLGLLKRKIVKYGYFPRKDNIEDQVLEVISHFGLLPLYQPFTLCLECNGKISQVEKQTILPLITEGIATDYEEFYQCEKCEKIYWKGSHYQRMARNMEELKQKSKR